MTISVAVKHAFAGFALDVAFEAPAGVTVLFGRSGSGKTSVINAVAGLLRPDQGRVVVGNDVLLDTATAISVPIHRRRMGYVFQDARLFPHLSVRQNLLYGRWFAPKAGTGAAFDRVVDLLGLAAVLDRRPGDLSGGEKQRVALGRALLCKPRLLLMDEPLAALDDGLKAEILPYLERLRDQTDVPILYVSHAMAEVARLATTLVLLEAGRVLRVGPADRLLADPAVAPDIDLREAGAIIMARIAAQEADGLTRLDISGGALLLPRIDADVGTALRVRIHAQDVILARERPVGLSALNILPAVVTELRMGDGPGALVQLRVGQDLMLARITRRSADALGLAAGASVFAVLKTVAVAREDIGRMAQDEVEPTTIRTPSASEKGALS